MADIITYGIYEPKASDIGEIVKIHNAVFKSKQDYAYYSKILANANNPFYIAVDEADGEVLAFIATRVDEEKSQVTIVALAEKPQIEGLLDPLIQRVVKACKKSGVKTITLSSRKSSLTIRKQMLESGFEETEAGTYRDGEAKFRYTLTNPEGKDKLTLKKRDKRTKTKPKAPPVEGEFKIRDAKYADLSAVLALHNKNLKRQRETAYFSSKINAKDGFFVVAVDSNGDVAGYLACRPEKLAWDKSGPARRMNFVSMAVDPAYRGWGIAKAMIKRLVKTVKANPNMEYIYGHVRGENESAVGLYRRMGFKLKKVGTYKDDGDTKYQLFMRLRLPSLKPYYNAYKEPIKWFAIGVVAHELIHKVRRYE